ncbi:MAG TPA: hypothetical protein VD905_03500 [Flavobacteriales bacterium]|nr:hypothetical protein [Flavobacteriales bacterium]
MKTSLFTLILIATDLFLSAQAGINQFDANGKKHGKWIVYWDANWKKTDSVNAVYVRYDFFHHGQNLQPMGPCGGKGYKLEVRPRSTETIGKAVVLDGEYNWYDDKGRLKFILEINKGEFVKYTGYRSNGTLDQVFDYKKHYLDDQPHSWTVISYDKNGNQESVGYAGVVSGEKATRGRD